MLGRALFLVTLIVLLPLAVSGQSVDCDTAEPDCNDNGIADPCEPLVETLEAFGADGDLFGRSAVWANDRLMIGAPGDDETDTDAGAVYVYSLTADGLEQVQQLLADNGEVGDEFGSSVFVSEDLLVVGAPGRGDDEGAAYVFRYDEDQQNWEEVQALAGSDASAGDRFGTAVAVSGEWIFVGAPEYSQDVSDRTGQVYIYRWDEIDEEFDEDQRFLPDGAPVLSRLGWDIDVEGGTAAFGAPYSSCGRVFVASFDDTTSEWVETQEVLPSDGAISEQFGEAVDLDGSGLLVGAKRHVPSSLTTGAAYYYRRDHLGHWGDEQKLTASDGAQLDFFGASVVLYQNTIQIGAPGHENGAVYRFALTDGEWEEVEKIASEVGGWGPDFGRTLVATRWLAVVGAPQVEDDAGAVCLFFPADCDNNGVPDVCDIDNGTATDANDDGIPDECQERLPEFVRGDVNGDGRASVLSDSLALLGHCFLESAAPPCLDAADVDGDNVVSGLLDVVALLSWAFLDERLPADPGPYTCGFDPDQDSEITCESVPDTCR